MNQERLMRVIIAPHVSEKSTGQIEKRQYVFRVLPNARKPEIKKAIETLFNVKVDEVQTVNVRGKSKTFRGARGQRSNWKKAYVKLSEGHEIDAIGAQ